MPQRGLVGPPPALGAWRFDLNAGELAPPRPAPQQTSGNVVKMAAHFPYDWRKARAPPVLSTGCNDGTSRTPEDKNHNGRANKTKLVIMNPSYLRREIEAPRTDTPEAPQHRKHDAEAELGSPRPHGGVGLLGLRPPCLPPLLPRWPFAWSLGCGCDPGWAQTCCPLGPAR